MKKNVCGVCVCVSLYIYIYFQPVASCFMPLPHPEWVYICLFLMQREKCVWASSAIQSKSLMLGATCWGTNQFNCWHFGVLILTKRMRGRWIADSSAASETTVKLITEMRAEDTHTHTQHLGQKSIFERLVGALSASQQQRALHFHRTGSCTGENVTVMLSSTSAVTWFSHFDLSSFRNTRKTPS